jgi:hypothetical protein
MTTAKSPRDYSKGIVYKLCCLDTNVLEVYVGSTICFNKKRSYHRSQCTNPADRNYNLSVYQFIRAHGGWHNWQMVQIEAYSATSKRDLESRERECMERCAATLNGNLPIRIEQTYAAYQRPPDQIRYQVDICDKPTDYYQKNKADICKRARDRYQRKNALLEKVACVCGSVIYPTSLKAHVNTRKHRKYLESQ